MKIHMFYINDILYAFTGEKEYANRFMLERKSAPLEHKVRKLTDFEFGHLCSNNKEKLIIKNYMDSRNGTVSLLTTYGEDWSLSQMVDELITDRDNSLRRIDCIPFKKKYRDLLRRGLLMMCKDDPRELNLDLVSMFVDINQEAFIRLESNDSCDR